MRDILNKHCKKKSVFLLLYAQTCKELIRNRLGLILIFVIPTLFLAVVEWTTGEGTLPIKLYFFKQIRQVFINTREISLVFMAAAIGGFLMSYYAVLLFHKDFEYFRYCIFMKLSPVTFIASRFCFFFSLVTVLSVYTTLLMRSMMSFSQIGAALLGFLLLGAIYGAYGGIVGILSKDFMIGILFVALLANIDAGWLQNPVFYSTAQQSELIRWLPAFFPCQFIFSAIFSGETNLWAALMSLLYASVLFGVLFLAVRFRIKGVYYGKHTKK
jgi:hypothetical protein